MGDSTLVIVHPDPAAIPDDGGSLRDLGFRCVVHRDPAASLPDLRSPDTAAVLFAAQLDSGLPLQVCEITAQGTEQAHYPVFFWGPNGSPAHLEALFQAGARDCFSEAMGLEEVKTRMGHHLRRSPASQNEGTAEALAASFDERLRELAHDLKNPLCVLYGYAQMAQMGHPISSDEAKDMVDSSREIREMIDGLLTPLPPAPRSQNDAVATERAEA